MSLIIAQIITFYVKRTYDPIKKISPIGISARILPQKLSSFTARGARLTLNMQIHTLKRNNSRERSWRAEYTKWNEESARKVLSLLKNVARLNIYIYTAARTSAG